MERPALTIIWRIENIGLLEKGQIYPTIVSPIFSSSNLNEMKCVMHLSPNVGILEKASIQFDFLPFSETFRVLVDCACSVIRTDREPLVVGKVEKHIMNTKIEMPKSVYSEDIFVTNRSSFISHDTLIVRCQIWKSNGDFPCNEHIFCRSRLDVVLDSFLWAPNLKYIASIAERTVTFEYSNTYSSFLLQFWSGGVIGNQAPAIFFTPRSIGRRLAVSWKVVPKGSKNKLLHSFESELKIYDIHLPLPPIFERPKDIFVPLNPKSNAHEFTKSTLSCNFTVFYLDGVIDRKYCGYSNINVDSFRAIATPLNERYQSANSSSISCKTEESSAFFTFSRDIATDESSQSADSSNNSCQNESSAVLAKDFLSLYENNNLSDFELRSGDVSFPVHKIILSARSPVFMAMFSGEMKEANSNFLDVPDLDCHTLNRMLTFLYSGAVDDLTCENALKLYYAADKYQISTLKQECSSVLRFDIKVSSVCDILALADRHQDSELTSYVQGFILENLDKILVSDEWGKFLETDSYLAGITIRQVYKKKLHTLPSQ